jgi:hypothetical protein
MNEFMSMRKGVSIALALAPALDFSFLVQLKNYE